MGFANRSHPIPDGGKCLCFRAVARLKTHHCKCNLRHCILISPWLLAKVLLIEVRSISKKRRFLFLYDLTLFQISPSTPYNLQYNPLFAFIGKSVRALLLQWIKCRQGRRTHPAQPKPGLFANCKYICKYIYCKYICKRGRRTHPTQPKPGLFASCKYICCEAGYELRLAELYCN